MNKNARILNQIEVLKKAASRENEFKLKADELQNQLNEMNNLTEEHELMQVRLFLETCCSNAAIEEVTTTFQQEKLSYESKYEKKLSQTRCNYDVLVRNSKQLREENEEAKKELIDLLQKCDSTGLQQDQEEMQSERAGEHRGSFMKHGEEKPDIDKGTHSQLSLLICELHQTWQDLIDKNQSKHLEKQILVQHNKEITDELLALEETLTLLEKITLIFRKIQNIKQITYVKITNNYKRDNDVAADRDVRVTQLKGELNEKTKEQEEMRSLIRWLKKDLYKANNDLIQLKKENSELVRKKYVERAGNGKITGDRRGEEEEFKRISRDLADRESDITALLSELGKAEMKVKEKTKEMKRMQKQMDEIEKDNRDLQEEIMAYENT
ncbi:hypothetical protein BSL78_15261 [Apostichopus japonicus]|uniref:Uncharacterized protein n=1 Tax=Stichopus japonicus TaxID=307972 RepID=A0A2G8KIR6_STIJA|nr:hypothetical protein BSL78_15261 [Apostichopus japonicus]